MEFREMPVFGITKFGGPAIIYSIPKQPHLCYVFNKSQSSRSLRTGAITSNWRCVACVAKDTEARKYGGPIPAVASVRVRDGMIIDDPCAPRNPHVCKPQEWDIVKQHQQQRRLSRAHKAEDQAIVGAHLDAVPTTSVTPDSDSLYFTIKSDPDESHEQFYDMTMAVTESDAESAGMSCSPELPNEGIPAVETFGPRPKRRRSENGVENQLSAYPDDLDTEDTSCRLPVSASTIKTPNLLAALSGTNMQPPVMAKPSPLRDSRCANGIEVVSSESAGESDDVNQHDQLDDAVGVNLRDGEVVSNVYGKNPPLEDFKRELLLKEHEAKMQLLQIQKQAAADVAARNEELLMMQAEAVRRSERLVEEQFLAAQAQRLYYERMLGATE